MLAIVRSGAWVGLCLWLAAAGLGFELTPAPVRAEDSDAALAASARSLFSEGVQFADAGQWTEAADRFRRALALRDSPVIAYNLASALVELGKLVEASELLRSIGSNHEADAELRRSAASTLAEITPRIGRLTVHAHGVQPGDQITLDERPLLDAQLDVGVPIDPGSHQLRAEHEGELLENRQFEVAPGGAFEVALELVRAPKPREVAAAAVPAPAPAAPPVDEGNPKPVTGQWWFWTGVGAVAVGAVVATVLIASSGSSTAKPTPGNLEPPVVHVEVPR